MSDAQVPSDELVALLREQLERRAFHNGEGQFAHIEYCDLCHYSRAWIAEHGHSDGCLLSPNWTPGP